MNYPKPLRMQLAAWSTVFTLLCLGTCLVALNLYLRYALSSSRTESMYKREHRLVRFLSTDLNVHPTFTWQEHLQHFLEATPETDIVEIDDLQGHRLYPSFDPAPGFPRNMGGCDTPCISTVFTNGHHARVLRHRTKLASADVRIVLIGFTDEHYDILHRIDVAFLGLLPLVLLGSVIGGYELSRRALAPVGAMTLQAEQLSLTQLSMRILDPQTGDELQKLAMAWNDMLSRLERSTTNITQFTADASHDLRTAITVILANAQFALRRERTVEAYKDSLNNVVGEAQHMLTMLEDLLLVARSGWSMDKLSPEVVYLPDLISQVYESFLAASALAGHKFELDAPLDDISIQADRMLLRRLISVLADNAIKYTPRGGRILFGLHSSDGRWTFSVHDTGVGIAPELQERIFERLFRTNPDRQDGNGLGLPVARWIADAHGFELRVRSEPGTGSTFTLAGTLLEDTRVQLRTPVASSRN